MVRFTTKWLPFKINVFKEGEVKNAFSSSGNSSPLKLKSRWVRGRCSFFKSETNSLKVMRFWLRFKWDSFGRSKDRIWKRQASSKSVFFNCILSKFFKIAFAIFWIFWISIEEDCIYKEWGWRRDSKDEMFFLLNLEVSHWFLNVSVWSKVGD